MLPPRPSPFVRIRRIALATVATVVMLLAATITIAEARWDRTFTPAGVSTTIRSTTNPDVIARGRYLAYGPGHCADCHAPPVYRSRDGAGVELELSGGYTFAVAGGQVHVPNLTPDSATGIGTRTDEQLVRALRYDLRHDGRAMLPFMEYQELADDDLTAIISFLRSQPAVRHEVRDHNYSVVSKAILAFLVKPRGPRHTPPSRAPSGVTVERGEYLVNSVAHCGACHTRRSALDGSYQGARLAGGLEMAVDDEPDKVFVTPNLTPDSATGRIANWTEAQFVDRMLGGRRYAQSHMPWESFGKMHPDDLRAIYRYLQSLAPVRNPTGESYRPRR